MRLFKRRKKVKQSRSVRVFVKSGSETPQFTTLILDEDMDIWVYVSLDNTPNIEGTTPSIILDVGTCVPDSIGR